MSQTDARTGLSAAMSRIKRRLSRELPESSQGTKHYEIVDSKSVQLGDKLGLTRTEATGHSPVLRAYRQQIGVDRDQKCPVCDNRVLEVSKHLGTAGGVAGFGGEPSATTNPHCRRFLPMQTLL